MLNSPEHPDPIPTISLYHLISSHQNLSAKIGLHYIFQAQKIPVTLWVKWGSNGNGDGQFKNPIGISVIDKHVCVNDGITIFRFYKNWSVYSQMGKLW